MRTEDAAPHGARKVGARSRRRSFLLLNIPRTGTHYAFELVHCVDALGDAKRLGLERAFLRRSALRRLLIRVSKKLRFLRLLRLGCLSVGEHHRPWRQTPRGQRRLPAISILREPLSWHVSNYLHLTEAEPDLRRCLKLLKRGARSPDPVQREIFRSFIEKYMDGRIVPETWRRISLEACWRFLRDGRKIERIIEKRFHVRLADDFPLGSLGCYALMFTHREPRNLFSMRAQEAEEYLLSGRWREDLCDVLFLRQERLREGLYAALLERMGYRKETLDAALELAPDEVNASNAQRKERALRELEQKPRLREEILRSERIYSQCILPLAGDFLND